MGKIAIVIHGGAGVVDEFIKQHEEEYKKGLKDSLDAGFKILESGGSALDAVEAAVRSMEDNYLFNAGKGAAFTEKGTIEMCASVAFSKEKTRGAAAIVKNVKNPVSLARKIHDDNDCCYLGNKGGLEYAKRNGLEIMPDDYFFTDHQFKDLSEARQKTKKEYHGTVGAVALDAEGNVAAATSTGGTANAPLGRIGDSSMYGVGSYADNKTCAISSTGDGEFLIQHVIAHDISALIEYKNMDVKTACKHKVHEKMKDIDGDVGVIGIDTKGNIAIEFNSERMHRGWKTKDEMFVAIYPEEKN